MAVLTSNRVKEVVYNCKINIDNYRKVYSRLVHDH